jgi:hypothetical protein
MIVSHTPGSALERKRAARLDIARRLDQALVTQDPDRVITRCDSGGRMVARHDPRRDQSSKEDCLIVRRAKQKSRREHWERPVGTEACGLSDVRAPLIANKGQPEPWRQSPNLGDADIAS